MDEKDLLGMANHVYGDDTISTIKVERFMFQGAFNIALANGEDTIIINSKEQWRQLKAIVENSIDEFE
jgi:hypothetical protein